MQETRSGVDARFKGGNGQGERLTVENGRARGRWLGGVSKQTAKAGGDSEAASTAGSKQSTAGVEVSNGGEAGDWLVTCNQETWPMPVSE